jgi:hypothetical protein
MPDWIVCQPTEPDDKLVIEHCNELHLTAPDQTPLFYQNIVSRVIVTPLGRRMSGRCLFLHIGGIDEAERQHALKVVSDIARASNWWRIAF